MLDSTITTKGQVTVPIDIRRHLALEPGDKVEFSLEDDHITIKRKENDIRTLFGALKAKRGVTLEDMKKAVKARGKI